VNTHDIAKLREGKVIKFLSRHGKFLKIQNKWLLRNTEYAIIIQNTEFI